MIQKIALIASILLPLWNIPLVVRIIQRKSSKDISLLWTLGVWVCLILMLPSGVVSKDLVWKVFCIVNFSFFSLVVAAVLIYRKK
ncbi:MAG: hypothetical protein HY447_02940 [Candidatus Omnitrophica bacterium]|nr:hypothetical protein [Candidatus Omnitrophota bacterium]